MNHTHIQGEIKSNWCTVSIDGKPLSPERSQRLVNHSPDGFSWGYNGSGPAQLAFAILIEFIPEAMAFQIYQSFKEDVISHLDSSEPFHLFIDILEWVRNHVLSGLELGRVVLMSTAHISASTSLKLSELSRPASPLPICCNPWGYWIMLPPEILDLLEEHDMPDLAEIVRDLLMLDIKMLVLDSDGPTISRYPTWEW